MATARAKARSTGARARAGGWDRASSNPLRFSRAAFSSRPATTRASTPMSS